MEINFGDAKTKSGVSPVGRISATKTAKAEELK
jgi:hypothetical protein